MIKGTTSTILTFLVLYNPIELKSQFQEKPFHPNIR